MLQCHNFMEIVNGKVPRMNASARRSAMVSNAASKSRSLATFYNDDLEAECACRLQNGILLLLVQHRT